MLVTGCSSGIGLFTAIEFAKNGDTVFAGLRDLSKKDVTQVAHAITGMTLGQADCL